MNETARDLQRALPLEIPSKPSRAQPDSGLPCLVSKLKGVVTTPVYDTYWWFAVERQRVFFHQVARRSGPGTTDPVLRTYKFTNAYRASDRVSQFLIRNVIYSGDTAPSELFFRTVLFKLFNRISTWELLERELGRVRWAEYNFKRYDQVLGAALAAGERIYSAAYIIPPASTFGHEKKHQNHLRLIERMMADHLPERLADSRSLKNVYTLLRAYPSIGDFLAYQLAIDLNYGPLMDHSESEFVVPGPGARDGIRKCFSDTGGWSEADLIRALAEHQSEEFDRLGLTFSSLWGRPLQLVDCQNLFCEVDKYARVAHPEVRGDSKRTRIKQFYRPSLDPIAYWYPPKWGLNDKVARMLEGR